MWGNLSSWVCVQQRRRPDCYSVPLLSLIGENHIWTCYKQIFTNLASLCSWAGRFRYNPIWNPEYQFCRIKAYEYSEQCFSYLSIKHMGHCTIFWYILHQWAAKALTSLRIYGWMASIDIEEGSNQSLDLLLC